MIKHIATGIIVSCAVICSATAQNIDKVFVKGGSVYEGYIAEQIPGNNIIVKTEVATLFVNSSDVTDLVYTKRDIGDLPKPLKDWARENRPDDKTLQLASLRVKEKPYTDVIILETGTRFKILSFANDTFELGWKDVVKTVKTENGLRQTSCIDDVVTLKDGKYFAGHVIEQIVGYELRIRSHSGDVNAVRFSDILSIRSEQEDPKDSLWDRLVLLDRVELKSGSVIEGFITSRVMGKYLTVITRTDAMEKEIPLKDVAKYVKIPNVRSTTNNDDETVGEKREPRSGSRSNRREREHSRVEPVIEQKTDDSRTVGERNTDDSQAAGESEVYMNGTPMTLNTIVLCDGKLNVVKNPVKDKVNFGTEIKIEMPASYQAPDLKVVKTEMRPVSMMASGNGNNLFPTFNKKDIENSCIGYGTTNLDNGNVEVSIAISEPGIYVLVPELDDNKCIVFEVIG